MCLLSSFFETIESSKIGVQALAALLLITAGLHFGKRQFKKQRLSRRWQILHSQLKQRRTEKRDKARGTMIFLLLLVLIASVAILWVLWALGGIFALILGIVLGVGILTLLLRG